jgi:hypothetical protein
MYKNRRLLIAGIHRKETVIAPVFEQGLQVSCFTNSDYNTDLLGTFSGEIERVGDPLETVRRKCLEAMDASGADLGIASEGSFGPHPSLWFVAADEELMIFMDRRYGLEITARAVSTDTNFDAAIVDSEESLLQFAAKARFPSHGLILRAEKDGERQLYKGITDAKELTDKFHHLLAYGRPVAVETDMRAHFNPSRMQVIRQAAEQLLSKVLSRCPSCAMPGFDVTDVLPGLPCELCGQPTAMTISHLLQCKHCRHLVEKPFPQGYKTADPRWCQYCNP